MNLRNYTLKYISALVLFLVIIAIAPAYLVKAEEKADKKAVTIGTIDYDRLTMQVNANENRIVYYSTDKTNWLEVEGNKTANNKAYLMDISWVSATEDRTIFFKGDSVTTIVAVTLPKRDDTFKVTYDKVDCDFIFDNNHDALSFEWKKASDFTWHTVSFETESSSYQKFLVSMEGLLLKGAKVNIRLPQIMGKNAEEPGERPSREVTVTLTKRAEAPSVKVNTVKLNLTTTTSMEYYDETLKEWVDCDRNMLLEDIAPSVLFKNGAKTVNLMIRTRATANRAYSKTLVLTIPGQKSAPTVGGSSAEVSYWYQNNRLMLQFNNASRTNIYSYAIVKPGETFDVSTARFNTVTTSSSRAITISTAPEGSVVYLRKQGTNGNLNRNSNIELSSEVISFTVTYK